MMSSESYLLLADLILITHALFVAFVVGGLLLIIVGGLLNWSWVRNRWFRLGHLAAIGVVVIQSWLGMVCPLTVWESALREKAGAEAYQQSFIGHWLEQLLYYQAPEWVFIVVYTLFAALVLACWFWVSPQPFKRTGRADQGS